MSGGTWDYSDMRLRDLADEVRRGRARWGSAEDGDELPFPLAREAMAEVLEATGDLLHELDWFFAGDDVIEDETVWMYKAMSRLQRIQFVGRQLSGAPEPGE